MRYRFYESHDVFEVHFLMKTKRWMVSHPKHVFIKNILQMHRVVHKNNDNN